jgi:pSer/pThr/pTyr-binding forkhead associated (FHA) protein
MMTRLQVPYHKVLLQPSDLDFKEFETVLQHFLRASCKYPVVLEIFNAQAQYLLFMRGGAVYWAAVDRGEGFLGIPLRRFFDELKTLQFPQMVIYYTDLVLYHSLLVYLQKKASLKADSKVVDIENLLDDIEGTRQSALVSAYQSGNLILIRYHEGRAVACHHGQAEKLSANTDIRELFLVKVYTLSAHCHLDLMVFTELVISQAEDARPIPEDYDGSISSFYLSQPPTLVVKLKNRPLKTYPFSGKQMTIGRNAQNDIVIDNLSVSRQHAVITSSKEGYFITNLSGKNWTLVNGHAVKEAKLESGDNILVGKYVIVFEIPQSESIPIDELDQTVIIPNFHAGREQGAKEEFHIDYPVVNESIPKLLRKETDEEYPIDDGCLVIGREETCDIRIGGLFSPKRIAEIKSDGGEYILKRVGRAGKVRINGERMNEKILEENDLIEIGSEEFVFQR